MSKPSHKVLLLQARDTDDPMLAHELECFRARAGLGESMQAFNLASAQGPLAAPLDDYDVLMMGGSGDFSVVKGGFDWYAPMLELMRRIVERRQPFFASCFGFQALVQALGGEVVADPALAELGTFEVRREPPQLEDPIFGALPERFDAQFGHNDSAITLPEQLERIASTERCAIVAVRHRQAPIWATQFHPELTLEDNMTRFMAYIRNYSDGTETIEEARQRGLTIHRPSPQANRLLRLFLKIFVSQTHEA